MLTLGIDTSNYATSLAVFDTDAGEVVCDCKKFLPVKEGQLGLRQSDALFHHTAALPAMLAELATHADLTEISAVGVSAKPRPVEGSYMPCFLAGVSAATAFALSRALPLVQLTHQQGHIAAALYATGQPELFNQETLVFHVSGGTTDLLLCHGAERITPLGTSSDLYAVMQYLAWKGSGKEAVTLTTDGEAAEAAALDAADVNGDGKIDTTDMYMILKYCAEKGAGLTPSWTE